MDRRLFLLAALALTGCVSVPAPPGAAFPELEALYAASVKDDVLTIRVASNGCTAKDDFAFFVERKAMGVSVAFGRKRVDGCRTIVAGHADLAFSLEELGVEPRTPLFILNPFEPQPGP